MQERKSRVRNRHEVNQAVRLVIVENGANVREFDTLDPDSDGVHIIQQGAEETPIELASRAIERLASIERSDSRLKQALLLLSDRFNEQSAAARELLARALMTHAAVAGAAELVLAVRGDADAEQRNSVLSLVEGLMGEHGAGALPIKIRFGDKPLSSPGVAQAGGVQGRVRPQPASRQARAFTALRGSATAAWRGPSR